MAKKILVANWKNHPDSLERAKEILRKLSRKSADYRKLSTFIAPPHTFFIPVVTLASSFSKLASQDISVSKDTCTGEVGVDILKNFGVRLAIVGHSERRAIGESDSVVAEKVRAALRAGITPLLCIGEHKHDAEGDYLAFIRRQLRDSLSLVPKSDAGKIIIAYEPIWAIGEKAKDALEPSDLSQMILFIRKSLSDMFGRRSTSHVPILYGGSVDASNVDALADTDVDGFLVGRASLRPEQFLEIARALK